MAHTYTNLLFHIIFSNKDRLPQLTDEIRPRTFAYMGGIIRELDGMAVIISGPADHVHMLVALPPTIGVSDAMRLVKTNSSRWIHETFPAMKAFAWQTGYGAFSVSQSNVPSVRKYIEGQKAHHRTMTFQEEFVSFLRRHAIVYDERYIWQ